MTDSEEAGAGGAAKEHVATPLAAQPRSAAYRVLARKYRPQNFDQLIGQQAMVRTLTNAFRTGRIAQAYMLTGVRGVGKTTTARIIARALNYTGPDGKSGPSIELDAPGEHCEAIMASRHVDVIEMDAASHTGIGDVREIIEAVRYKPASARYKVYIIDEVHMLSKAAFNGLLKTLEEPPEHVKFIFATTEIRKVPITVLSRCQRFDLRRIDAGELAAYLKDIVASEQAEAEDEALALIARAAEGSARDALSILDQAIAHAGGGANGGKVSAEQVRDMLGLADRSRVISLFRALMAGDVAAALAEFRGQYDAGADPVAILGDLAAFVHFITRVRYVPEAASDQSLSQAERSAGSELAASLDIRLLSRAWQMLLKGIEETANAQQALAAAEMVLVRIAHASDLPTPDELIRYLRAGPAGGARPAPGNGERAAPAPRGDSAMSAAPALSPREGGALARDAAPRSAPRAAIAPRAETVMLACFEDIVALAGEKRDLPVKRALEEQVRLVRFEPGRLEISLDDAAPANLAHDLSARLSAWTGMRWMVIVSGRDAGPTLAEKARRQRDEMRLQAAGAPQVRRLLDFFPGAEIVEVRDNPLDDEDDSE